MSSNGDHDADVWIGLGMAEAAAGTRIVPAPLADIVQGGRRIRRRRRTVVGAVALASVVALGGGALAQLRPAPTGSGSATALVPAAAPDPAAALAKRDPLRPARTLLAEGTTNGHAWKVWRAIWPLAPKERAYEQAVALWQERSAYDPRLTRPTEEFVRQYWQPDSDLVNDYVEVDGVRQGHDSGGSIVADGHISEQASRQTTFGAGMLGHYGKDDPGPFFPAEIGLVDLGPRVGKVFVTWSDGTRTEVPIVVVPFSPIRVVALAQPQDKRSTLWEFFDQDGQKMPNEGTTLFR
ncbi:hypothetical protein VM98_30090 [Streptomyces rubellomurinus subsp. indigoferus]|nr:hypothetical protein VM98_30090 [Streptomyces rubellomurinus subsp. indigoferus]